MKTIKIVIISIVAVSVFIYLYLQYQFYTYVDKSVKTITHIEHYKMISKIHDDQQWYANILISKSDGEKLMKIYTFKYGNNPAYSTGKYQNAYIKNKPNCWYYFNDKNQGPYGYTLLCLSNDKTQLEVYDLFGN